VPTTESAFWQKYPADPHSDFKPDKSTQAVIQMVEALFAQNFGALEDFGWPVTRLEALAALDGSLRMDRRPLVITRTR
jgi:deoxyribodipyrimidine photolyase-related protein